MTQSEEITQQFWNSMELERRTDRKSFQIHEVGLLFVLCYQLYQAERSVAPDAEAFFVFIFYFLFIFYFVTDLMCASLCAPPGNTLLMTKVPPPPPHIADTAGRLNRLVQLSVSPSYFC